MARNVDIIIRKDVNGSGRGLILSKSPILALFFRKWTTTTFLFSGYSVPETGFGSTCFRIRSNSATPTGGGSGGEERLVRVC